MEIAFSISFIADLSYGWTVSIRGSGAEIVAIWRSGVDRAVVVDDDPVEQGRAGPAGADGREFVVGRLDGLLHPVAGVFE